MFSELIIWCPTNPAPSLLEWLHRILMENHDMNLSSTSLSTSTASPSSSSTTTSWFSSIVRGRSASVKMASKSSSAATGDSLDGGCGPINKKRQFRGVMFKYGPKPIQVRPFYCISFFRFFLDFYWSKLRKAFDKSESSWFLIVFDNILKYRRMFVWFLSWSEKIKSFLKKYC